MGLIRTEALVLRALDFSESTQIAHFYSPTQGKFSAIARGVKRLKSRLGPRLEAFAQVEVSAYAREGASIASLSSIELLQRWPILQKDLKAFSLASLLLESVDQGTEEARPSIETYNLALSYLRQLDSGADADSITAHALLRLICLLGFAPDLTEPAAAVSMATPLLYDAERGANATQGAILFFIPEEGHFSTTPPQDSRFPRLRLEQPMRDWLRASMGLKNAEFSAVIIPQSLARPVLTFLIQLIQYYLELELKSARFLRRMIWEAERGQVRQ